MGDLKSFQMRFVALRQHLVADGIRLGVSFHDKDLQVISERILREGTSFVEVTLPILGRALDKGLVTGSFICPANFAMRKDTRLPRLLYSVFRQVFSDEGLLLGEPLVASVFLLRQFLLLDSKLISEPTVKQQEAAVQGFIDRQSSLLKVKIPVDNPVLRRARWLAGEVLRNLDLSDISPGHGPGAVAEGLDHEARWDFRSWPAKAERVYPYVKYGTPSMRATLERGIAIPLVKTMSTRCCLVPKDFRGPRLISAEPTVNQYLQQGQMKAIMRFVAFDKCISKSIKLDDQSFNQKLAQRSYQDGTVTLDLSDASDTVSTALVWYLLGRLPKLRRQLMSTRSDFLIYNDRKIRIVAFAPMGSAVCFPVESLVFWLLSMASLGHVRSLSGFPDERESLASDIAVFGDDIIIPDDALSLLVSTLLSVGCSPNMSKTCYWTPFRESCGSEWFNGADVTIIRNKRYHYDAKPNISNYPVLLGLQRKFFLRGLYSTAKLCEEWAREIYPVLTVPVAQYPLLNQIGVDQRDRNEIFASTFLGSSRGSLRSKLITEGLTGSGCVVSTDNTADPYFLRQQFAYDSYPVAIGWDFDHCVNLPIRWNGAYHRLEFRVPAIRQDSRSWRSDGYPRLHARLSSVLTDRFVIRSRKTKMTWAYLPTNVGTFMPTRGR